MNKNHVCYSDFGARGDGVTNDFFALQAAHEYANEKGLPVRAETDKTYLISNNEKDGTASSIIIKTDTDWCGATVIVDDSEIAYEYGERKKYNTPIISIESYCPRAELDGKYIEKINREGGITKGVTKKIETGLGYPAMLVLRNEKTRHFIRYGVCESQGMPQRELLVVDKDGNIDETTPLLFSFDRVDSVSAVRLDIPVLTLENGTILSKASLVNMTESYYMHRGISIIRPNTHIKNIEHRILGELDKNEPVYQDGNGLARSAVSDGYTYQNGAIYDKNGDKYEGEDVKPFLGHSFNGMFSVNTAHNVLLENVVLQARIFYMSGTYDLGATMTNMLVLKNCRQSNFYGGHDKRFPKMLGIGKWWGVAGTNFCKNMIYDGCQLTRYDAHAGVTNGKVINSEIGSLRLTGGGDMLIENTTIYYWGQRTPIQLRDDYGSTWDGDLTFKNVKIKSVVGDVCLTSIMTIESANHFFGYKTHFPNVTVDNLAIENIKDGKIDLLEDFEMKPENKLFFRTVRDENIAVEGALCRDGKPNVNPYTPPKFIKVINNEKNGYEITVPDVPFFRDTELEGVRIIK